MESVDLPFHRKEHYGEKVNELGKGTYGSVWKCSREDKTCVAVKKFFNRGDEGVTADTLREISILIKLSHPNIVKI